MGDIDGDGDDDLVASATRGPGEVRVFRVNPGQSSPVEANPFKMFRAFATNFLGGATVAVADLGTFANGATVSANALLHRDAVFAELSTAAPLFTAPVDLDGDQLADTFFHALGDQGQQPHAGVRVTDPPGADSMTISQLDYSQRLASSRPARSPGMTTTASGLMFEDLQVGTTLWRCRTSIPDLPGSRSRCSSPARSSRPR